MMSFLEDYLAHLANALKNSGIELDQMDVLDSFNSNEIKYWNELNYVDVFNLVRKYFPNTMSLVNESNETFIRNIEHADKSIKSNAESKSVEIIDENKG